MAGDLQINDRGDVIRFDGKSWVPADIVVNDAGKRMAFDGQSWVEIPGAPKRSFIGRVADNLADVATYGPLGMVVKAADKVTDRTDTAALDNLKTGAIKGISGFAAMPQMLVDAPSMIAGAITGTKPTPPSQALEGLAGFPVLPSQSQVQAGITQAPTVVGQPAIEMRKPETMGGRLLQDVGQAIGGAPFAPMMGYNLASGVGSWGLGEVSNQNPWMKMLGSVLGAGTYGLFQQTAPNAVTMLRRRLQEYTPAELNAAEALQREAQARGIQLMPQEVLDRMRGDPMAQLAGNTAVQPQGRPIQQLAAARVAPGGSIPTAIEGAANTVAPRVANPNEASRALGAAADAAVLEPQIARVVAANPLKAAAAGDALDAALKAGTLQQIDAALAKALPGGPIAGHLEKFKALVTNAQTVGQMDEALDAFRTIYKSMAFEGSKVPDSVRTALKPLVQGGYAGLETTNPNYQAFREIYKGTAGAPSPYSVAVEQAQASPAARIAAAQSDPATEGALGAFGAWLKGGTNVPVPDPAVVKSEIARLAKQNPQAARDAVRALIQRHADAAFSITKEGVRPPDSGVGFVKNLAGTEDTRKAIIAAIEGVTGNQSTAKGFDRLLEIIQRTGVTPGLGSPTQGRAALVTEAGQGGAINLGLEGLNLTRGGWLSTLHNANERLRAAGAFGQIADLFTQPDSVAKIRQLALMNPASNAAQLKAALILQGVGHTPPKVKGTPR